MAPDWSSEKQWRAAVEDARDLAAAAMTARDECKMEIDRLRAEVTRANDEVDHQTMMRLSAEQQLHEAEQRAAHYKEADEIHLKDARYYERLVNQRNEELTARDLALARVREELSRVLNHDARLHADEPLCYICLSILGQPVSLLPAVQALVRAAETLPDWTTALMMAQEQFQAHPMWNRLTGTPWENDAPVGAALVLMAVLTPLRAALTSELRALTYKEATP